jgi:hypothetical protein
MQSSDKRFQIKFSINIFKNLCVVHAGLMNSLCGVMVSVNVFTSIVAGHWFDLQSCQIKDYKISICHFSVKHATISNKNKD